MDHCRNCGKPVQDLYCSHCGQKNHVDRITLTYLWQELFHFFTHIEHGFIFTSVKMLAAPGPSITEYVRGKRKSYQSPVSYFLVWTTIFLLTLFVFARTFGENQVIDYKDYFGPGATTRFAISHLSLVLTLIIPVQAFYLFILVTRGQYNYFESLVAAIYAVGTIILLQFVFAVLAFIAFLLLGAPVDLRISDTFKAAYLFWFIFSFLSAFDVSHKTVRGIAFCIAAAGTFLAWRLLAVPDLISLFLHSGH